MHALTLVLQQAPAPAATDPLHLQPYLQYGAWGLALAALSLLGWVIKSWSNTNKETTENLKAIAKDNAEIAKDNADRTERQTKECNDRNDKTTATVDAICDRFGETQVLTAKLFAETVSKQQVDAARLQEQHNALVREINDAKERSEERLHDALRDLQSKTKPG